MATPTWRAVVLVACIGLPNAAAAVTIYRFGGEGLPPPAEASQPGVEYRQLAWTDIGANGGIERLTLLEAGLGPAPRNALSPSSLRDHNTSLKVLFDQDPMECGSCGMLIARPYTCVRSCSGRYGSQGTYNIDLGDRLFVERVRIKSGGADGLGIVEDFAVYLSPLPLSGAAPQVPFTAEVSGNTERIVDIGDFPAGTRTAAIQLALPEHEHPLHIAEVYIYARGAAGDATYTSDILDFGRPAVWGALHWSLLPSPESRVSIATRGGDHGETLRYWRYTGIGDQKLEVTPEEYLSLRTSEKAGTSYNHDSWTVWSSRFDLAAAGGPPLPPKPRRALQMQVRFETEGENGSQLEYLEVRASDPSVSSAVGELAPIRVDPGVVTYFTYTLKPTVTPADLGFDHLEIRAVAAQFVSVQGVTVDDAEVPHTVTILDHDRLVVGFPRVGEAQTDALVEVRFQARVLRYGAAFAAQLFDADRPYDVPQPVTAGDAVDAVFSDRVWIETSIGVRSVLAASVSTAVLTPNGDGANDETRIAYDLFETTGSVPVGVVISDLVGHRVRSLYHGEDAIGHYERPWDGRDDAGDLVAPGVYIYRVSARVGGKDHADLGLLHVAY